MKKYSHNFTNRIIEILTSHFSDEELAIRIFESSPLLQYINIKTKSADKGSKSRGSFANHYALYVIVEDYIKNGFFSDPKKEYSKYEGAIFSYLFARQRELPFGAKLQNHALNSRCNEEFKKYFPLLGITPIVRDTSKQRYWIHEDLLKIDIDGKIYNIASSIIQIIDTYVQTKREAFEGFIDTCKQISELSSKEPEVAKKFVIEQLQPNVDARIFEIISFAVLKAKYGVEKVWIGFKKEEVFEEHLILYKTGRTNANDGGIDFVMKPLGRFFQVTETVEVTKYFLDIDKVQRFPITFVVKSNDSPETIRKSIEVQAKIKYKIDEIVNSYMDAVEEIINVNYLVEAFESLVKNGQLRSIMNEIIEQSKVEFNYFDEDEDDESLEVLT